MKKYFVLGNPIEHSLSPKLHNFWIKNNNLKAIYEKKKIKDNEIEKFISDIRNRKVHGANVTVPFKKTVIPYLDLLSFEAKKTQSVNTIYLKNDKIVGHNTDVEGFEKNIKALNFNTIDKKILILGAGGVVPSLIFALHKMKIYDVTITNRTKSKVEDLKKLFKDLKTTDWGTIQSCDIIINATSLGLNKNEKINLDFSIIGQNKLFYDVIYNPKETEFLKTGKRLGNKIENGILMFIHQAAAAFKIWHNIEPIINDELIKFLDE